jgi:hypothetical protein
MANAESSTRELLDADAFEDLPGESQAAIPKAEGNRPKLWGPQGD